MFHTVITNTKDVGQNVGVRIRPAVGTFLTIDLLWGGQDNYGGNRQIDAYLRDLEESGNDLFKHLFSLGTIDNDWYAIVDNGFQGITDAGVTQIENPIIPLGKNMWFSYDKEIYVLLTSAADNETLTLRGSGWVIGDNVPTLTQIASSESTITTDHNIFYGGVGT